MKGALPCLALTACAAPLAERASVIEAPREIRALDVAVEVDDQVGGYWGRKRLGELLVGALGEHLERDLMMAGYRVRKSEPALVLRVSAALDGPTHDLRTVTQLEVLHRGRLVDRIEVATPFARHRVDAERYPSITSRALMNRLSTSRRLREAHIEPVAPPSTNPTIVASFGVRDASSQLDELSRAQLGDYLVVRATQVLGFRFVPEQQVRKVLRSEKRASTSACFDAACQIELGRALAAEKTILTELIRVGDRCALTALVFDLATETTESATTVETPCDANALLGATDRLVNRLSETAPG